MRTRPQLLILAGMLAASAAASPLLGARATANDEVIVQLGQTLSEIALSEGTTVAELAAINALRDPNRIFAGQRLRVRAPVAAPVAAPPAPPAAAPSAPAVTHRVAWGETLSGIAERYRVNVAAIAAANNIGNTSYIRAGQVLAIPNAGGPAAAAAPAPSAPKPAVTHRVAWGETLSGIAERYRVNLAAIAAANGIGNTSYIQLGQVLTIPGAAPAAPAPSSTSGAFRAGAPNDAMSPDMAAIVARRQAIGALIVAEAERQGVPVAFALAVAWQESGWQPNVVSYAGAIGVMQLLPASGEWVGDTMLGQPVNLWDPASNVRAGVRLLRHYLDRYGGSRELTLAAYYQGQTAVDRHGIYAVSRPYIAAILELERIFAR